MGAVQERAVEVVGSRWLKERWVHVVLNGD